MKLERNHHIILHLRAPTRPAGINFPELANRYPITPVKTAEVTRGEKKIPLK